MKRWMAMMLALLCTAAGCAHIGGSPQTTGGSTTAAPQSEVTLLVPNAALDNLEEKTVVLPKAADAVDAGDLTRALAENGAVPADSTVLSFEADGVHGKANLNKAFADGIAASGTAGETMMLASLVNTLCAFYELSDLTVTAEGKPIETGHNVYDMPLTPFVFETGAENSAFTRLAPDADEAVRLVIVNAPTDVQREQTPATETVFDGEAQDPVLIVPRATDAKLTLWAVDYADGSFTKREIVFEREPVGEGFVLGGSVLRPEGVPLYMLVLTDSAYTLEYLFSYNGKDGVPNLELIQAEKIK